MHCDAAAFVRVQKQIVPTEIETLAQTIHNFFFSPLLFRISLPLFTRHARTKLSRNPKEEEIKKKNAQRMVQMAERKILEHRKNGKKYK